VQSKWIEPFKGKTIVPIDSSLIFDQVNIKSGEADLRLSNNILFNRLFLSKGGIKLRLGYGLSPRSAPSFYIAPSFGYNLYDGYSLGLLFHNLNIPQQRFQFAIAPQFAAESKTLNGMGAISYSFYPLKAFKEIRLQTDFKSFSAESADLNISEPIFARFIKFAPSIEFVFKEKDPKRKILRRLVWRNFAIQESDFIYRQNLNIDSLYRPQILKQNRFYTSLFYQYKNDRTFHPYGYNAELQMGSSFLKLNLETHLRIDYDLKGKSLFLRAYAGKFIATNTQANNTRYFLNTTFSGANDYLYQGTFIGRNEREGLWANQVSMEEGAFKIPTNLYANPLGRSNNWLLAINLKTDLPLGKVPIRFYADIATFADAKILNPSGGALLFNAGLELTLFKELLSIYAPLILSKDYKDYLKSIFPKDRLVKTISFSFNLRQLNGLRAPEYVFKNFTL
jgi:hypothetical protein